MAKTTNEIGITKSIEMRAMPKMIAGVDPVTAIMEAIQEENEMIKSLVMKDSYAGNKGSVYSEKSNVARNVISERFYNSVN